MSDQHTRDVIPGEWQSYWPNYNRPEKLPRRLYPLVPVVKVIEWVLGKVYEADRKHGQPRRRV
jgi:hypothetical protein